MSVGDLLVVLAWGVGPTALAVVAVRRLRHAGSRAIGGLCVVALATGFAATATVLAPSISEVLERSFAGHMVQHLVLGLVGPLLVVIGRLPELLPWVVPAASRNELRRGLGAVLRPPRSVALPTAAMVATWYLWHVPALYGAAVDHTVVHVVEHGSFLGVGTWFWAAVAPHRRRLGASVVALFVTTVAMGLLGATLALSPEALYAPHVAAPSAAALLDDQHLGGLLMWTPGGLVYLVAAVTQLVRWLDPGDVDPGRPRRAAATVAEVTT